MNGEVTFLVCPSLTPMQDQMKTKNFYIGVLFVLLTTMAIWLFISPSPNLHTIVSETHRKITNLKNLPSNMKSEQKLEVDPIYLELLGFTSHPALFPHSRGTHAPELHLPVIASSVTSEDYERAVHLLRSVQKYVPSHLMVFYDLGMDSSDLFMLKRRCNSSSSCVVKSFDFSQFPSHIHYKYTRAYRPLCIQETLKEYGAVIWVDPNLYFISGHINQSLSQAQEVGLAGWTIETPTSALTHSKMFQYFKTSRETFYFHHAVEASHLVVYNTYSIHHELMLPWVKCALMEECINPTGAQNVGCNYRRRPFFRYSGCHHYDMSALNVILGLNFNTKNYASTEKLFDSLDKEPESGGRNISFFGGP